MRDPKAKATSTRFHLYAALTVFGDAAKIAAFRGRSLPALASEFEVEPDPLPGALRLRQHGAPWVELMARVPEWSEQHPALKFLLTVRRAPDEPLEMLTEKLYAQGELVGAWDRWYRYLYGADEDEERPLERERRSGDDLAVLEASARAAHLDIAHVWPFTELSSRSTGTTINEGQGSR